MNCLLCKHNIRTALAGIELNRRHQRKAVEVMLKEAGAVSRKTASEETLKAINAYELAWTRQSKHMQKIEAAITVTSPWWRRWFP